MSNAADRLKDKRIFLALATIAWADGSLDADEADAIVRAALDAGLDLDAVADIEAATTNRVELASIDLPNLPKDDRVFVYAMGCWVASQGKDISDAEAAALQALGEALGIPEKTRARAEGIVAELARLPDDRLPAQYDLAKLQQLLVERLAHKG